MWDLRRVREQLGRMGLDWEQAPFLPPGTNSRVKAITNIGDSEVPQQTKVDWRQNIQLRDPQASPRLIDLSSHYTEPLNDPEKLLDTLLNDLSYLPRGLQRLGKTEFDVRGIIQLFSIGNSKWMRSPGRVGDIPINLRSTVLHFLHATKGGVTVGVSVGQYIIHYAEGQQETVPIVYGENTWDWRIKNGSKRPIKDAVVVAWHGTNPAVEKEGGALELYDFTWTNPHPDQVIHSIDCVSARSAAAPFLIAITAE